MPSKTEPSRWEFFNYLIFLISMSLTHTNLKHDFTQPNFGAIVNYETGVVWLTLTLMLPLPGLNVLWLQVLSCFESGLQWSMIHLNKVIQHTSGTPLWYHQWKAMKADQGLGRLLFYFQNSFSVCVYRIRSIWVIFELWVCTHAHVFEQSGYAHIHVMYLLSDQ